MKKRRVLFLVLAFGLTGSYAHADGGYLNLRAVSEPYGYRFFWDPLAKNALVEKQDKRVSFHSGSAYAYGDGKLVKMSVPSRYVSGDFMVPQEALSMLGIRSVRTDAELAAASQQRPAQLIRKVVVDAGHGGKDSGAISPWGLQEKDLVLDVSRLVKEGLERQGIRVVMTRSADVFIPLTERTSIANKSGADFFISIHGNASETGQLSGFEIYHLSEATDTMALAVERAENSAFHNDPRSRLRDTQLESLLWKLRATQNRRESLKASEHISQSVRQSVAISAERLKSANFHVLRNTEFPAILVELGYLTNREDERRLNSPIYRRRIAEAIVEGFIGYKRELESNAIHGNA